MKKTIMIIGELPSSLINFRGEFIRSLKEKYKVYAVGSGASKQEAYKIRALGAKYIDYSSKNRSISLIGNFITLMNIFIILKRRKPDIVFNYSIKPVIFSSICARVLGINNYINLITGLGYTFNRETIKQKALNSLIKLLYKVSLPSSKAIIFQNKDNFFTLKQSNLINIESSFIVKGSGVNLKRFKREPIPKEIRFLMIARLSKEKGIFEYINTAKKIKSIFDNIHFDLVGPAIFNEKDTERYVQKNHSMHYINYYGPVTDVRPFLKSCSVYVLPSYHEGLPRSTLEAMATGRAILTTNASGCRETVVQGSNGWLVQIKSSNELFERALWFIQNKAQLKKMGHKSYMMAKEKFCVQKINRQLIDIIEETIT